MSSRQIIAFDIETCPQDEERFSPAQQARMQKALRRRRGKSVDESLEQVRAAVRALSPYLGWICCISICRFVEGEEAPRNAHSYAAARQGEEEQLLKRFWKDLAKLRRRTTWVSFNGKRFDSPYIRLRSLCRGIEPTASGILNEHRWRDDPHCDLYRYADAGLADYCDLLGVATPKGDMDGSQVWPAIQEGRLADVIKYCEKDALATLRCYLQSRHTFA